MTGAGVLLVLGGCGTVGGLLGLLVGSVLDRRARRRGRRSSSAGAGSGLVLSLPMLTLMALAMCPPVQEPRAPDGVYQVTPPAQLTQTCTITPSLCGPLPEEHVGSMGGR